MTDYYHKYQAKQALYEVTETLKPEKVTVFLRRNGVVVYEKNYLPPHLVIRTPVQDWRNYFSKIEQDFELEMALMKQGKRLATRIFTTTGERKPIDEQLSNFELDLDTHEVRWIEVINGKDTIIVTKQGCLADYVSLNGLLEVARILDWYDSSDRPKLTESLQPLMNRPLIEVYEEILLYPASRRKSLVLSLLEGVPFEAYLPTQDRG